VALRRTAVVKLAVDDETEVCLRQTIERFKEATQIVADSGWAAGDDEGIVTSSTELHHRTYDEVRERTGQLNADLVCAARNRAAAALRSCAAKREQGKSPSKPTFTSDSAVYTRNAVTYDDDHVTLASTEGRVRAEFVLPEDSTVPPSKYLTDDWEKKESTLHRRDGDYYLHVAVTSERDEARDPPENGTVLGVDLGVENIAVTSTGSFWSGGYLDHRRREYERVRGELQRTDTESAHRTIEQMGERESRWANDYLHRLSKAIVREARDHGCSVIAFEELTGIRERLPAAKRYHVWAFERLHQFVRYKASEYGIECVQVDPSFTSQQCSRCGVISRRNRTGQSEFHCEGCGYENHADYNAAKNVGMTYLRSGQTSPGGGATGQLALKSGALTRDGRLDEAAVDS
jgi:putative transposase